ncbi:fibronectin type III domain-containing protein [Candidatus Saccharibacteria bacterium]|nr:fibronectin type III domain-containing protein [Candidatus Saccharibacteria bacterium]
MQPTVYPQPQPNRYVIRKIIVSVVVILVIAAASVLIFLTIRQGAREDEVQSVVISQNKILKASAKDSVYPSTLPDSVVSTNSVTISAVISTSGTTYCIAGTSKADANIMYHMDIKTPENDPLKGDCSDGATAPPSTPGNLAISSVSGKAIVLSWNAAPYAANYKVQCATNEIFTQGLKTQSTKDTKTTIDTIAANTDYYCRVAASNSLGDSTWSSAVTADTNAYSTAPTDLKTKNISTSQINLIWKAAAGAQSYIVQYSPDIMFVKDVVSMPASGTTFSANNLKPGTTYFFHVQAVTSQFDQTTAAYSETALGRTYEK